MSKDHPHDAERGFETGKDERAYNSNMEQADIIAANKKRTYDAYQSIDLQIQQATALQQAKINSMEIAEREQRLRHVEDLHQQKVRHADLAIDRTWNVDEQSWAVEKILNNTTFQDAVKVAVIEALQNKK